MLRARYRLLGSLLVAGTLFGSGEALAAEYEIEVEAVDEDDLTELFVTDQISEDTYNTLIQLRRQGVDLNRASRAELYALPNLGYDEVDAILAYRKEAGQIVEPAALVAAGALSLERLKQIAPFLVVVNPDHSLASSSGRLRYQVAWSPADVDVPSSALQARVTSLRYLSVGAAAVMTRQRLGDVRWDPNRDALSADRASVQLHVPKYFAQWDTGDWAVLVGTYRAGFAQRLTFDNTNRFTPDGFYADDAVFWDPGMSLHCRQSAGELGQSPCSGDAANDRVSSDFRWRDSLTGVAFGLRKLGGPDGWASVHGFASYQKKSIGQYEIYNKEFCEDPRNDDDPVCSAPQVFERRPNPLEPTSRYSFSTLPDLYAERVAGGNASYYFNRRTHLGVTGYQAEVDFLTEGTDLDFQEWARTPFGGSFGAVGVDGAFGHDWADVFFEAARSFDDQFTHDVGDLDQERAGGGMAGIVRATGTWDKDEVELVGRYYDRDYANPFARPIAAADEFDGLRARDEMGGRLRYTGRVADKLELRTSADVWVQPSENQPKTLAFVRGDYAVSKSLKPGLWLGYQNKDLGSFDREECFQISTEFDERGEAQPCGGEKIELIPRVRLRPTRRTNVLLSYEHQFIDDSTSDGEFDDKFRQDVQAVATVSVNPIDPLRVRARVRYKMEDINNNQRLEQSVWSYLDVAYSLDMGLRVRARWDVIVYLDDRTSTESRDPNPEQWGRLELLQKF